jgi:hypothetical protein
VYFGEFYFQLSFFNCRNKDTEGVYMTGKNGLGYLPFFCNIVFSPATGSIALLRLSACR